MQKELISFIKKPKNLQFIDIDGDGLADLVYTEAKYNETLQKRCVYTIMEKNKGGGTFAEPKIIAKR